MAQEAWRRKRANSRKAANRKNQKTAAEATRTVKAQEREAARREKYGPSGRPAPVIVRSLETGEVLKVRDQKYSKPSKTQQKRIEQARYEEERRRELEEKAAWLDESLDLRLERER